MNYCCGLDLLGLVSREFRQHENSHMPVLWILWGRTPPPPLEGTLTTFAPSSLFIFFYQKLLETVKNDTNFWHMRSSDHFGRLKMLKKTPCTVKFELLQTEMVFAGRKKKGKCTNIASYFFFFLSFTPGLRAYSFCAVFLFRFINRNRNRRVQKERLSFERNNFHGNKMAHCLISNWKGKKYENIIRKRNSKEKYGRLSRQTPCLRQPCYLLRFFSPVFERVFMVTSKKWRAATVLTAVLFEGKSGEKDAEQNEE